MQLLVFSLLLSLTFLPVESVSGWKPLENSPGVEEFTLCLSTVPWCGESRAFMNDFLKLVRQEARLEALQLRYIDLFREKTSSSSRRSITVYHKGGEYRYLGTFSPSYVLASLLHVLSTKPENSPFQSLHSADELEEFTSSTDAAVLLIDFCGWTLESREDEIVEDKEMELLRVFQLKGGYDTANQTTRQCSPKERYEFEAFHRNLTEIAYSNFLTPYTRRLGVVTSLQVLEDAGIVVPRSEPWLLLCRSQDVSPSWRLLEDGSQLNEFHANSPLVVEELTRDSELPSDRPSVIVFLQRGSHLQGLRDGSIEALSVIREVARYFRSLHSPSSVKSNGSGAVKETVKTVYVQTLVNEQDRLVGQLTDSIEKLLHLFVQDDDGNRNLTGVSNSDDVYDVEDVSGASNLKASFYFGLYDGADVLQESLTGINGTRPSVVAIFPDRDSYYVYPDGAALSFSYVLDFLEKALAGSLQPFARSGPTPATPREPVVPPFVNLDFHQIQSVPQVTVETFSEAVLGLRKGMKPNETYESDLETAWRTNTLVIFTQSWCGFCKRMELAVHEAYRSFSSSPRDTIEQTRTGFEVPAFYQMDCTENHCSHILQNILQVEEYPAVVLFPAKRKDEPIVFKGSPTVKNIFRFITASLNLGPFYVQRDSEGTIRIESGEQPESKQSQSRLANQVSEAAITVGVGNVLLSSDKLSNASSVFEKAAILIISVTKDHVMGLIINKPVQWRQLSSLDSQLQIVTSAYLGYGGPVYEHPKHFFTCTRLQGIEGLSEITHGLYVGGPSPTERVFELIEARKLPPTDFSFYVGHCGWSLSQLQEELIAGYWDVSPFHEDMLGWKPERLTP